MAEADALPAPARWEFAGAALTAFPAAPTLAGHRTAAIGEFQCDTAAAGGAALTSACARLRAAGFGAVLGPMNGSTWGTYRLVTESDGRPPFLLEPANPPWYVQAFEAAGFQVVGRYRSSVRDATIEAPAARCPDGITLRSLRDDELVPALGRIYDLCLVAFADNAFYTPLPREAFASGYSALAPRIDPDLVLLAEDAAGSLQGFLFALPDPTTSMRTAILKTYASLMPGCGSALANAFHDTVRRLGYDEVIHALMHDDNRSAGHSTRTGGRVFRRYALYGRTL